MPVSRCIPPARLKMDAKHSRVAAIVDLEAIVGNLQQIAGVIGDSTKVVAVIKSNGYGHGAIPIARRIEAEAPAYLWGFAVATVEEATALRAAGIKSDILLLGYTFAEDYQLIAEQGLTAAVFTLEMADQIAAAARSVNRCISVHLVVDTGMSRIGFPDDRQALRDCVHIAEMPGLKVTGLFTHFARADEYDPVPTEKQLERYRNFAAALARAGVGELYRHCANSAAVLNYPETKLDLCRTGIILYGLMPSAQVDTDRVQLKPALELKSHIVYIKEVPAGTPVSYGGTFITAGRTKIATIPVGYGDGYPRSLSNRGYVLIRGQRAPLLGRVCMDQFMVDVTGIPGVQLLDPVTLIGRDGDLCITMEELGEISGRFNYELACNITARVPRVYR